MEINYLFWFFLIIFSPIIVYVIGRAFFRSYYNSRWEFISKLGMMTNSEGNTDVTDEDEEKIHLPKEEQGRRKEKS